MKNIQEQIEHLNKLKRTTSELQAMHEQTMANAIKNAPIEDKSVILKLQATTKEVVELAKQGKLTEAINLTKNFKQ